MHLSLRLRQCLLLATHGANISIVEGSSLLGSAFKRLVFRWQAHEVTEAGRCHLHACCFISTGSLLMSTLRHKPFLTRDHATSYMPNGYRPVQPSA